MTYTYKEHHRLIQKVAEMEVERVRLVNELVHINIGTVYSSEGNGEIKSLYHGKDEICAITTWEDGTIRYTVRDGNVDWFVTEEEYLKAFNKYDPKELTVEEKLMLYHKS